MYGKVIHRFPECHVRQYSFVYKNDGSIQNLDFLYLDPYNTSLPFNGYTDYLPYRFMANSNNGFIDFTILERPREQNEEGDIDEYKDYYRLFRESNYFHFNGDWIPIMAQFEWLSRILTDSEKEKLEDLNFINAYVGIHDLKVEKRNEREIFFWSNISEGIRIYLDELSRIDSIDATGSAWNVKVYKAPLLDIEKFANTFAARPIEGIPSPRDNIFTSIDGVNIHLGYGRPSRRDRKIFGNIVPYDSVWRTGAGGSTILEFDQDLDFEGTVIPKGKYNIYTIPRTDSWTLIFNTQENAFGSVYLPEYDFKKVEMRSREIPDIVEKFTIEIINNNGKNLIQFIWENTSSEVRFKTSPIKSNN
jgi:hypothetical protein